MLYQLSLESGFKKNDAKKNFTQRNFIRNGNCRFLHKEKNYETKVLQTDNEQSKLKRLRVLIADDCVINLLIMSKILASKNVDLLTAGNGEEALDCLDKNIADIVLLDLEMPVMNGFTAVRLMKEKYPALPVIAFTANFIDAKIFSGLREFGFDDYIMKPIIPKVIHDKIESFAKAYSLI